MKKAKLEVKVLKPHALSGRAYYWHYTTYKGRTISLNALKLLLQLVAFLTRHKIEFVWK